MKYSFWSANKACRTAHPPLLPPHGTWQPPLSENNSRNPSSIAKIALHQLAIVVKVAAKAILPCMALPYLFLAVPLDSCNPAAPLRPSSISLNWDRSRLTRMSCIVPLGIWHSHSSKSKEGRLTATKDCAAAGAKCRFPGAPCAASCRRVPGSSQGPGNLLLWSQTHRLATITAQAEHRWNCPLPVQR